MVKRLMAFLLAVCLFFVGSIGLLESKKVEAAGFYNYNLDEVEKSYLMTSNRGAAPTYSDDEINNRQKLAEYLRKNGNLKSGSYVIENENGFRMVYIPSKGIITISFMHESEGIGIIKSSIDVGYDLYINPTQGKEDYFSISYTDATSLPALFFIIKPKDFNPNTIQSGASFTWVPNKEECASYVAENATEFDKLASEFFNTVNAWFTSFNCNINLADIGFRAFTTPLGGGSGAGNDTDPNANQNPGNNTVTARVTNPTSAEYTAAKILADYISVNGPMSTTMTDSESQATFKIEYSPASNNLIFTGETINRLTGKIENSSVMKLNVSTLEIIGNIEITTYQYINDYTFNVLLYPKNFVPDKYTQNSRYTWAYSGSKAMLSTESAVQLVINLAEVELYLSMNRWNSIIRGANYSSISGGVSQLSLANLGFRSFTLVAPPTGEIHEHTYSSSWSSNETYHWHAATCGHDVKADSSSHVFSDWTVTRAATATSTGTQERYCKTCNYRSVANIPATGSGTTVVEKKDKDTDAPDNKQNTNNNPPAGSSVSVSSYAHPNAGRATQIIRMFNPASGEHIITTDDNEAKALEAGHGWKREAASGMSSDANNSPVFRLLHPATGKHIYTLDANEVSVLTTQQGWKTEKVVFFAGGTKVKMYRLFNPKLPPAIAHHYTTDENEYNTLQSSGWQGEKVAFTLN